MSHLVALTVPLDTFSLQNCVHESRSNQDQVQGTGDLSQRSTALSGTEGAFHASAQTQSQRLAAPLPDGTDIPEDSFKKFCNLESIGICAEAESSNNSADPVLERFRETIRHSEVENRPVIRESSLTTKIPPVFDASAKGYNGLYLNDCLETGPSLIPNLTGILLRFWRWQIGLTADITKAFLQIKISFGSGW
ncbi:hypothetical protein HOLleu_02443 [Holothuria leucospilota]|uniref:Uncharacterized protein n=1 Tax=Holothuria leucospilota TaxID=206669 RepID=A0A9Q1HJR7_HOLLE|nr:hypothetical protein HOLleu_02443 [Holothuria leucospilota]